MTDPVDITQQATQAQQAGGVVAGLGALGIAATAFAKLWATIFGSRKERQDANERAAEIALRAAEHADERAEHADERAERADEQSAVHKREHLTCEEQLSEMRAEIRLMRADLDALRAENVKLRREQEIARGMLADLMRNASTPPHGLYTPEDVRAALAAQEDTGP